MADPCEYGVEGSANETARTNASPTAQPVPVVLAASASSKSEGKSGSAQKRRASSKPYSEAEELINLLHGSDPVKVELNRLENEVRGEDDGAFPHHMFPLIYLKLCGWVL